MVVKKFKKKSQDFNYDIMHLNAKGKVLNWRDWDNVREQVLD
jgi:hypothetical protein